MIDRGRSAVLCGYFHLALVGALFPVAAFPISGVLAILAWRQPKPDRAQRTWARRLTMLAVVDALVLIAATALFVGKASVASPRLAAPPAPRIGVVLDLADDGRGARVVEVQPGSPAERAGLRPGDVINHVDEQSIVRNVDLTEVIATTAPGGSRWITVARGEVLVMVHVVPEVRAPEPSPARQSLFERDGPSEPLGSTAASLLSSWLALVVLLGIVCIVAARRGVGSPRPWIFWLAFAGVLAAADAALFGSHMLTSTLIGGDSLGGSLIGLCLGSGTLLVLAVLLRRRLGHRDAPSGAKVWPTTIVAGVAYMITGVLRVGIILTGIGSLLRLAPPDPGRELRVLVERGLGPTGIALVIFAAVILAPIGEETLFRGVLLPWLRRFLGPEAAVWVSAVLFGIGHLRYGLYLSTIVVYGLVLGWARLHTGTLRASIVLHMIINAVATGLALIRF